MLPQVKVQTQRFRPVLLIVLLLISGTLIVARWKASAVKSTDGTGQGQALSNQLEAELVTATPTGFEPAEITRPQGRFMLAVDNRSGLHELEMYFERETQGRINVPLSRKGKLAWREVIDLPAGTYVLRATNDESWRCRITITPR